MDLRSWRGSVDLSGGVVLEKKCGLTLLERERRCLTLPMSMGGLRPHTTTTTERSTFSVWTYALGERALTQGGVLTFKRSVDLRSWRGSGAA
eukprot:70496-Rhodomonas_salina.1